MARLPHSVKSFMKKTSFSYSSAAGVTCVEASAGSGKTYALAQRYIQLLVASSLHDIPSVLRSVLAITFTNKATIEMKERIIELLKQTAFDDSAQKDLKQKAQRIMDELIRHYSFFQVQTIDSFINAILLGSALRIDRSAQFTIQRDYRRHVAYCLDAVIDQAADDIRVRKFLEDFLAHYLFVENRTGWFPKDDILKLMVSLYAISNRFGCLFRVYAGECGSTIKKKSDIFNQIQSLAGCFPEGMNKTSVKSIEKFLGENDRTFSISSLPNVFQKETPSMNKNTQSSPAYLKKWQKLKESIVELIEQDAQSVYDPYIRLFHLFIDFFYRASKKEDVIFLEELNHAARSLFGEGGITVAELYYRLAARFRHYLIDEFQDTSVLQWRNLKMMVEEGLSTGGSLFYVGDRKQAIYRFRGGESQLFDAVQREFRHFKITREALVKNWRSQKSIVQFNNAVFSQDNLCRGLIDAGIEKETGSAREICAVFKDAQQEFKKEKMHGYVRVERIGERTREERDELMRDKLLQTIIDLKKRFCYEDIAVLTRDNDEVALVSSWLLEAGISVESEKTLNVLEHGLIKELLAFLRFLHAPVDAISFTGFVAGDIFAKISGINKDEISAFLFTLHKEKNQSVLYRAFQQKYADAWNTCIEDFFKSAGFVSLYEMLVSIYRRFNLMEHFKDSQAFFMKFLELVKQKETEYLGLGGFLTYVSDAPADDLYVNVTRSDSIQVHTIHKAKGLEFPVVILPFLRMDITPETGGRGTSSYVVGSEDSAMGLVRITKQACAYSDKLKAIYAEAYNKACIDELNNMYVALTRAQYELYVFIPGKSGNSKNKAHYIIPENISEMGSIKTYEKEKKEDQHIMDIPPAQYRDWVLQLKNEFSDEETAVKRKQIEYGNILHALLSQVGSCHNADVQELVSKATAYAGNLFATVSDFSVYERKITALLAQEGLRGVFYVSEGGVFCEKEVINRYGDTKRIDRLIVGEGHVWIIDYKSTCDREQEYGAQIKEYMDIMRDIYPGKNLRGSLLYLDTMELVDIKD